MRKLAADIRDLGHEVWLDQWEIRVGDCIATKIEQGVAEADYVVLALSAHSVQSGWVEREWKTKYWEEVSDGRVRVLPVLLEKCDIPPLLKSKHYADFRENYGTALVKLMAAIAPTLPGDSPLPSRAVDAELMSLIQRLQATTIPTIPLAEVVAAILGYAHRIGQSKLAELCSHELAGYEDPDPDSVPPYRVMPVYASTGLVNMQFVGWGGDTARILLHMEQNPKTFVPQKLSIQSSLAEIETQVSRAGAAPSQRLFTITQRLGDMNPHAENPETTVYLYGPGDTFERVLIGIRGEFSRQLIRLLPRAK